MGIYNVSTLWDGHIVYITSNPYNDHNIYYYYYYLIEEDPEFKQRLKTAKLNLRNQVSQTGKVRKE